MENWKDIPGYEECYQVSDLGRVRSVDREYMAYCHKSKEQRLYKRKGKVLIHLNDNRGYHKVHLGENNQYQIHRCVALAFIPNPDNKPTVDHIDRNPHNNKLSNLRWYTYAEQNLNKYHKPGELGHRNIQFHKNHYNVRVKRNKIANCVGSFKTLPEAIEARDNYLTSLE